MDPQDEPRPTGWEQLFPPAGLELRAGDDLLLRYVTDDLVPALADVARAGIHDPAWQPLGDWTDTDDAGRARRVAQHVWRTRAELSPARWLLSFAVVRDGVVVGRQDVGAEDFAVRREVHTGSWLGQVHQGHGTGRRMRLAVLSLAFDHLGARSAVTSAWKDNEPSNRLSRRVGYRPDGEDVGVTRGQRREGFRYRMPVERWRELGHPRVEVVGLGDECRSMLGA